MSATQVKIMNRALAAVGHVPKVKIALANEDTTDARLVRRFYDETLEGFLDEAWWSWATKYEVLSEDSSEEPSEWGYAYAMPADIITPRRLVGAIP